MYLTQIKINSRLMAELAREHHLPISTADIGYRVHVTLTEIFGDEAPKPFWVRNPEGQHVDVFGYADSRADDLQAASQLHASSLAYETCNWSRLHSKPMPGPGALGGAALQYELRACPVVRKGSAGKGTNLSGDVVEWESGTRMDAFLSQAFESGEELSRDEAYGVWLRRQFDVRDGGAEIRSANLRQFELAEVTRRAGNAGMQTQTKPVATIAGELQVTEPEHFTSILFSGLGQHKSFGMGMMLVRPA